MMRRNIALIPAAGVGARFGAKNRGVKAAISRIFAKFARSISRLCVFDTQE